MVSETTTATVTTPVTTPVTEQVTAKFSIQTLNKARQYIRETVGLSLLEDEPQAVRQRENLLEALPKSVGDLGDIFRATTVLENHEPGPNIEGRWFLSSVNPGEALLRLPGLGVKPGFRLVTYLLRTKDGGIGHSCAVPEHLSCTVQLEAALTEGTEWHYPPFPEGALQQIMEAIDGDRSPLSFLLASLWRRELQELGTAGKDRQWGHHRLIETVPQRVKWRWKEEGFQDLAPKVKILPDQRAAIEFFSARVVKPYALYRHMDIYEATSYIAKVKDQVIALADD